MISILSCCVLRGLYKGFEEHKVRSANPTPPHLMGAADKIAVDAGAEPSPPLHMDASPEIAAADCEEGSSNGGRDEQDEKDWLRNAASQ